MNDSAVGSIAGTAAIGTAIEVIATSVDRVGTNETPASSATERVAKNKARLARTCPPTGDPIVVRPPRTIDTATDAVGTVNDAEVSATEADTATETAATATAATATATARNAEVSVISPSVRLARSSDRLARTRARAGAETESNFPSVIRGTKTERRKWIEIGVRCATVPPRRNHRRMIDTHRWASVRSCSSSHGQNPRRRTRARVRARSSAAPSPWMSSTSRTSLAKPFPTERRQYEEPKDSDGDRWGRKPSFNARKEDDLREATPEERAARPKLSLQKRSTDAPVGAAQTKSSLFGGARPREEALKEAGRDWQAEDLKRSVGAVKRKEFKEEKELKAKIQAAKDAGENVSALELELTKLSLQLDDKIRFAKPKPHDAKDAEAAAAPAAPSARAPKTADAPAPVAAKNVFDALADELNA